MKKQSILQVLGLAVIVSLAACKSPGKNDDHSGHDHEKMEKSHVGLKGDKVNFEKSKVTWSGEMLNLYEHSGIVKLKEASVKVENGIITDGTFVADLSTMKATDENYNVEEGKTPEKLIGHLSSPDFFNVAEYPTATFEIESVSKEDKEIKGTLTIKGNSGKETVKITGMTENSVTGTLTFNRNDYGVDWEHPVKDNVLSKDVELEVTIALE